MDSIKRIFKQKKHLLHDHTSMQGEATTRVLQSTYITSQEKERLNLQTQIKQF